ncbi:MAG: ATP-grasp domain-containing protein [Candidatus Saccharimonadales bacterium]
MKKVLLVFSYKKNKLGDYDSLTNVLNADKEERGYEFIRGALKEFEYTVTDGELKVIDLMNNRDIANYDLIFFRMWFKEYERATAAAAYLEKKGVPFFDPEVYNYRAFSKLTETSLMATAGIPVPDTLFATPKNILKAFTEDRANISFPIILKSVKGIKGNDNYLVKDLAELKKTIEDNPDIDFIAQEYIPNDSDYRLWVVGDKVRFAMRRVRDENSGSHLNNTSKGAIADLVDVDSVDEEIKKQAVLAAQRMKRGFTGVDVIIDKDTGKHYFLELNNQPEILGVHIDDKLEALHEYIAEEINAPAVTGKQIKD